MERIQVEQLLTTDIEREQFLSRVDYVTNIYKTQLVALVKGKQGYLVLCLRG